MIMMVLKLLIVFGYFNKDLRIYIDRKRSTIPLENVKDIMSQVLQALFHSKWKRIMHRDLKPSNLLIEEVNKTIKLSDFGLTRTFGKPLKTCSHEVVTLWNRAQEILLGSKVYSSTIEMWNLGCIFYELVHNFPIFQGKSEIE
jgi:serine/threonine protein kinase